MEDTCIVPSRLAPYIKYLNNTGPISRMAFEEDHAPIGSMIIDELKANGLVIETTKADMEPPEDNRAWFRPRNMGLRLHPALIVPGSNYDRDSI